MSNSWHEEARALAQKGFTQVEIAKQFNVSSGAVRFALNVNHMKERHSARTLKYHEEKRLLANKITAEQDITIVREIALYYLNCMCAVMPDYAATMVFDQMDGV